MGGRPLADVVTGQYETWVYPEPIRDLPAWLAGTRQWFGPGHAHRMFWPDRDFDLVFPAGVPHHMADPNVGMRALARSLRPDGVEPIMLYARHGRIGVEMLQATVRASGLRQDEAPLGFVRASIASLPQDHPARSHLACAPDLTFDAGLVVTFLHGRDLT